MSSTTKRFFALGLCATALVAVACANEVDMGDLVQDGGAPPSFVTPPDGGGDALPPPSLLSCVGTQCPEHFASCLDGNGNASYKCGTDLRRDNDNCGECGNKCLLYKPIHMTSRCVDAVCELQCFTENSPFDPHDWRNCNTKVDDGCETDVLFDAKHCGACGNSCGAGVACFNGKCGCPAGLIYCEGGIDGKGFCTNPNTDDNNCGGCGNVCNYAGPPGSCDPLPNRVFYGCKGGTCDHIKCQGASADCNGDIPSGCGSDGCEVENLGEDPNNCGGCGIKCKGEEQCINEGNGPECAIPCVRFGKVQCGRECADLLNDTGNCGSCGNGCRAPGPNQKRACKKGLCEYECATGFADCNGDPTDGCEVDLRAHPANCGACGNKCNTDLGQPCIEGQCLMTACDGGVTK